MRAPVYAALLTKPSSIRRFSTFYGFASIQKARMEAPINGLVPAGRLAVSVMERQYPGRAAYTRQYTQDVSSHCTGTGEKIA